MSLNANEQTGGGGGNIEPLNPGTYPARLVMVVDLGLQVQRPYQGQEKPPANEISLTYEFVDEFLKDENGNDQEDKPRWLSEIMTFRNLQVDKAKSTKRYMALDPAVKYGGDWTKLLGTPCNVTIVHNPGKGKNAGRVYENIAEVTAMRDKDAKRCPKLVNAPKFFDLDNPDLETFKSLPPFIQSKIRSNLNYAGSKLEALGAGKAEANAQSQVDTSEPEDNTDENPY